jgi:hypothetical protein
MPAPGTAYWGAWINGAGTSNTEEQQTEALETLAGRKLALHMHYFAWTADFADSPDLQADLANHRTPVVTWSCGPDNTVVAAGGEDATTLAAAVASVKNYKAPIFIRWNWEMNLPGKCMGTGGAAGYIAAWQHIYNYFKNAGVTNVAWLWNPAKNGSANGTDAAPYWPGAAYVDWIGFDGYDKSNSVGTDPTNAFSDVFKPFYDFYTGPTYYKNGVPMPILIAETGECQASSTSATIQKTYVADALRDFQAGKFPDLGGWMYFDAKGGFTGCPNVPANGWVFDAFGGQSEFITLGQAPAFAATVPGT